MADNETIADNVREMRDRDSHSWMGKEEHEHLCDLADRIDAAAKRDSSSDLTRVNLALADENAALKAKVKRLLSALDLLRFSLDKDIHHMRFDYMRGVVANALRGESEVAE